MFRAAAIFLALLPATWAQAVISAHSGLVNFVEGEVKIADQPVKLNGAIFPDVKVGQTLSTQMGRAEVLLTPGVFLRVDNNSSFRMISSKLTDTQVEILSGSALVEAAEILKDNRVVVKMGEADTLLLKNGLYHFNADAGQVRAFQGKAEVSAADNSTELKGGRTLLVGSSLTADKFDKKKSQDELYAWSQQRDYRLALANISVAHGTSASGFSNSMWAFDPWMGMYTFLLHSGRMYSPFGIAWYSPGSVWTVFQPTYSPDYGYGGYSGGWQGTSPSFASSGPSSNASTGSVGASSGSSSAGVASSAGASRGR